MKLYFCNKMIEFELDMLRRPGKCLLKFFSLASSSTLLSKTILTETNEIIHIPNLVWGFMMFTLQFVHQEKMANSLKIQFFFSILEKNLYDIVTNVHITFCKKVKLENSYNSSQFCQIMLLYVFTP